MYINKPEFKPQTLIDFKYLIAGKCLSSKDLVCVQPQCLTAYRKNLHGLSLLFSLSDGSSYLLYVHRFIKPSSDNLQS